MSLVSHKKWSIERQPPPRPRRTIEFDCVETPDIKRRVSIYKSDFPAIKRPKTYDSAFLLTSLLILHCQPSNRRTFIRSHDRETIESPILDPRLRNSREPEGVDDEDGTRVLDAFDHPSPAVVIWCQFFAIKWKTGGFRMGKKIEGTRWGRSAGYFVDIGNEEETRRDILSRK